MSSPLSDNQERLMIALRRAPEDELTTREAGDVRDKQRNPIGADNARKALGRLEDRGLVAGDGPGMERRWRLQSAGEELINELRPPADNEGESPQRPYFVFEELGLGELIASRLQLRFGEEGTVADGAVDIDTIRELLGDDVVYVKVDKVVAVNGRHAYRQVGKRHYRGRPNPRLVAVADRMFQPREIQVNDDPSVSVSR